MSRPIAWTIAGSDSGGGAGIQADLLTMNALGVHGCSTVTAITAQSTQGIRRIEVVPSWMVEEQLRALEGDLPPQAVKTGMLATTENLLVAAHVCARLGPPLVCDPVLAATLGGTLLGPEALDVLKCEMLPRATVLTPNLTEAETLADMKIAGPSDAEEAAARLLAMGAKAVLLKGGHMEGETCADFWTDGRRRAWLSSPRLPVRHTHGGGCTLSAAIAACLALGHDALDAAVVAKAYVNQGLRTGGGVGRGRGPLAHGPWPSDPDDMPHLGPDTAFHRTPAAFPPCDEGSLGLYPVVDRAAWVDRLGALGVRTIQIRVKDLADDARRSEIEAAAAAARARGVQLYVNDDWEAAVRCGAHGVHLGQDDLDGADLGAVLRAGLRLGISTHGYGELARALACRPSYVALGTLFESPSKSFAHAPLGLDAFARIRRLSGVPVVAIGGITLESAPAVLAAGADGCAIISDILRARDLEDRVRGWQALLQ
jgi:hydroxymethylpyrimidine kinase/phosphomethylpyrimidine kinase/thiamine-phosphate diphosphorylase